MSRKGLCSQKYERKVHVPPWFWIIVVISTCSLFCWYISPERQNKPSKVQIVIAKTWIILRRLICFSGSAFGLFTLYILWEMAESIEYKLTGSIIIIFLSIFFAYVGIVGQGWYQYSISDDFRLYKKIKDKYGIRW